MTLLPTRRPTTTSTGGRHRAGRPDGLPVTTWICVPSGPPGRHRARPHRPQQAHQRVGLTPGWR